MIIYSESGPNLTVDDIHELEIKFKLTLPKTLVHQYLSHNGGYIKWVNDQNDLEDESTNVFVHDGNKSFCYAGFFPLEEVLDDWIDEMYDIPKMFEPNQLLVFGYGHPGLYGISLREQDFGSVFFYITEEVSECYAKWDTFEEFIGSFIPEFKEKSMTFNNSNYFNN